jgi:hypothetical protein
MHTATCYSADHSTGLLANSTIRDSFVADWSSGSLTVAGWRLDLLAVDFSGLIVIPVQDFMRSRSALIHAPTFAAPRSTPRVILTSGVAR